MNIIKQPIKEVLDILGKQECRESAQYRLSSYVISVKVKEGILLYNTLLGSIVLYPSIVIDPFLIANWYYVTTDCNEHQLVEMVRNKLRTSQPFSRFTTFTIYTTTDCNARCYYCFENGRKRISMKDSISHLCSQLIVNKSLGDKVTIRWFGGEPLCNQNAINIICNNLNKSGVKFESKMATNGYLFDSNLIMHAKNRWNLIQVQITLDGTENNYNKIKKIKTNLSAFQKVLSNIQTLSNNAISVVIRLNVDNTNIDDQFELVKNTLIPIFEGNSYISIYSHLLMTALYDYDKKDRMVLFKKKQKIDRMLFRHGLSTHKGVPHKPSIYKCIADNRESITILPNGKIGLCEHYTEEKFISDLQHFETFNMEQISHIRTYNKELNLCKKCPFHPRCIRLIHCPDCGICNLEIKHQNIQFMKDEVISEYLRWQSLSIIAI